MYMIEGALGVSYRWYEAMVPHTGDPGNFHRQYQFLDGYEGVGTEDPEEDEGAEVLEGDVQWQRV